MRGPTASAALEKGLFKDEIIPITVTMNDIDLWELNEAFAVQVIYRRDKLGIPADKLNVHGGGMGAAGVFEVFEVF